MKHCTNSKLIVPSHLLEGFHIYFLYPAKLRRPGCCDIRVIIPHPIRAKGDAQSITKTGRRKKSPHAKVGRFFKRRLFHPEFISLGPNQDQHHKGYTGIWINRLKFHRGEITEFCTLGVSPSPKPGRTLWGKVTKAGFTSWLFTNLSQHCKTKCYTFMPPATCRLTVHYMFFFFASLSYLLTCIM